MANRLTLLGVAVCLVLGAETVRAQTVTRSTLTITPSIGLAVRPDNGRLASGGMTTLLEIDLHRTGWRWGAFGEVRGIGIACSDGCDVDGQVVGVTVSRLVGAVAVGGGLGGLHRTSGWHLQPHGQLSLERGRFRAQFRVEVPRGTDGTQFPLLGGVTLPVG